MPQQNHLDDQSNTLENAIKLHRKGDTSGAEAIYKSILTSTNPMPAACSNLATIWCDEGEYQKAINLYKQGLTRWPDYADAYNNLGAALIKVGNTDEALVNYQQAISLNPNLAQAYLNLGRLYKTQGDTEKALSSYLEYININTSDFDVCCDIGNIYTTNKDYKNAVLYYQKTLSLDPKNIIALTNLGNVLKELGEIDEAINVFKHILSIDPSKEKVIHLLAAISGQTTETAPDLYISDLFDSYANNFDNDLVNKLSYQTPTNISNLLQQTLPTHQAFKKAIDLGCGTGLSGKAFQKKFEVIDGIDLSQNMLKKAAAKDIYRHLIKNGLVDGLIELDECYDLFICTDVLIYIGAIEALFECISRYSNKGAMFCFSTEALSKGDYILRPSGRYAQSNDYIRRIANVNGFCELSHQDTTIRVEHNKPILGELFIFKKA